MDHHNAEFIKQIRQSVRDREIERMMQYDPRFNTCTHNDTRAEFMKTFTWHQTPPQVCTWNLLCQICPGAQGILDRCLIDENLESELRRRFPCEKVLTNLLDEEQRVALVMMVAGYNVFVTGSAGVGKSKVVSSACLTLKAALAPYEQDILVCGSTGVAAFNVSGLTLHSTAMLMCADEAKWIGPTSDKMKTLSALLIDEISMVSTRDFYRTHMRLAGAAKKNNDPLIQKYGPVPFGGRQIICVGDFFQLSDVKQNFTGIDKQSKEKSARLRDLSEFRLMIPEFNQFENWQRCFLSPLWAQTFGYTALLERIQRQTDAPFIRFLTQLRWNQINQHDAYRFVTEHTKDPGAVPYGTMFLYSTNAEADRRNAEMMQRLVGPDIHFSMLQLARKMADGSGEREQHDGDLKDHRKLTSLRIGARARIWCNYDTTQGITNGTQCELVGLVPITELSYATSFGVFNAQMAIDPAEMRNKYKHLIINESQRMQCKLLCTRAFDIAWTGEDMGISLHMKSGTESVYQCDRLHPLAMSPETSSVHKYGRDPGAARGTNLDYDEHADNALRCFCPVVRFFHIPNELFVLSPVMNTRSEQRSGKEIPIITQVQVPLIPGYASTVHAAQGLTLESVAISLQYAMDPALPYVALTRATNAASIYLVGNLDFASMRPDTDVILYYGHLKRDRDNKRK